MVASRCLSFNLAIAATVLYTLATAEVEPFLVSVSASKNFECVGSTADNTPCPIVRLPQNAAVEIISVLAGHRKPEDVDKSVAARLALHQPAIPEVVLVVQSTFVENPDAIRSSIHTAMSVDAASVASSVVAFVLHDQNSHSKQISSVEHVGRAMPTFQIPQRESRPLASVLRLVQDRSQSDFANNQAEVLATVVHNEDDKKNLLQVVKMLRTQTKGKLAVLWTFSREADAGDKTEHGTLSSGNTSDVNSEALSSNNSDNVSTLANATAHRMRPPEISVGALSGLLVVGILLLILVPGILCLYGIQTPASFVADREEISDRRKNQ